MRKCRLYSLLRKTLSALLCLSMMLSIVTVTDFSGLFHFTENVKAEETTEDMLKETLEARWDDESYKNASRPFYTCQGSANLSTFDSFGGVYKRTIFHVYAFEGETICLGSSVFDSGLDLDHKLKSGYSAYGVKVGKDSNDKDITSGQKNYTNAYMKPNNHEDVGSIDIIMTDLKGNTIPIDIRNSQNTELGETAVNSTGYISCPAAEEAAVRMKMNPDGTFDAPYEDSKGTSQNYTPYTYKVKESGVYTFEFHSFDKGGVTNLTEAQNSRSKQWPTAEHNYIGISDPNNPSDSCSFYDTGGMIAALNITVFDENCQKQTGRTYADYLSLQMGLNNANSSSPKGVNDSYYILTTDSYIYKMQFNNVYPYTYNFFSNNRGIFDTATGEIVYKSVKDIKNDNNFPRMGSFFVYPGNKETEKDKSYYIFLEYPDDDLEGEVYQKAVQPDPATNIRFVGRVEVDKEGSEGVKEKVPGAYVGVGGYFAFDVKEATTATLRLDFNNIMDKSTGDPDYVYAPVEISGVVKPNSTNYFYWDGCDGNGVPIPAGRYNLNDIVYTVTTKAGEIHFPIFDMECAPGGITFTRMSHIYDKNGKRLDYDDNIYGMTKNVIYYDETAIYYGENVGVTGISENQVDVAKGKFNTSDGNGGLYYTYANMKSGGSEYSARGSEYIKKHKEIRVGDHSHTTNVIKYFSDTNDAHILKKEEIVDDQQKMIDYLSTDTGNYPAGKSASTSGGSTTDYAIANYWTFIPAKPATAINKDDPLWIVDSPTDEELFKLSGRVFYDGGGTNGEYDDSGADGEHLLSGVTLNLYKKTEDDSEQSGKSYYNLSGVKMEITHTIDKGKTYELVDTGITRTDGSYIFTNLTYDPTNGTEYLYEVVRPNPSYKVTSESTNAKIKTGNDSEKTPYGYYSNHSFNDKYKGTEIQQIKVGGDGVEPKHLTYKVDGVLAENPDSSVCAVDVGYTYTLFERALTLKKDWNTTDTHPDAVVYELSYCDQSGRTAVYDYRTLSAGGSWANNEYFLPQSIDRVPVDNYYISAEYFIDDTNIYKYVFSYDNTKKKYHSFVATPYKKSLKDVFKPSDVPTNCSIKDLPDLNGDGVSDGADMGKIRDWSKSPEDPKEYRAVLDRDMPSGSTVITVTNSEKHGTIEIYKHKDINDIDGTEANALQGATFRLYQGDMETIKGLIADSSKAADLAKRYIGSATTRANGRLTFTGLDPSQTYTVREMFAPDGYRITEEFYEVRPKGVEINPSKENVFKFGDTPHKDYVEFPVGNAQADDSLRIRKQISGRAWQDGTNGSIEDSFTFTISNEFNATVPSEMTDGDHDIKITAEEQSIQNKAGITNCMTVLNDFAELFQTSGTGNKATINYGDEYYSYTVKDSVTNKDVTYTSADTKMSGKLLDGSTADEESKPTFNGQVFPMAGEYTFTITEDKPTEEGSLEYSPYTYKVTISVIRKFNPDVTDPETTTMTVSNTHLEAEVSKITYSTDGTNFRSFTSSSPLFTNTYKTAPAEQKTSYNIVKNFTGRTSDEWTESDKFTVEIICADPDTINAVKNGNLVISGFTTGVTALPDNAGWEYTFKKDHNEPLKFSSFKFEDIEFPVQYVDADGNVWTPPEGSEQTTPTAEEIESKRLTPQTLPVTYTFKIKEKLPEGITDGSNVYNGITYDTTEYDLKIVLNNTEQGKIGSGEEEDGIIEEIDVTLSTKDDSGTEVKSECKTRQGVMEESEWLGAIEENKDIGGLEGLVKFYYIDSSGNLQERKPTAPTDAKLYFWKWEHHSTTGSVFGRDGHTMNINNEYHTSYKWQPRILKNLNGRDWTADDKFKFTIEPDSDHPEDDKNGYIMPKDNNIIIEKDTKDHAENISAIEFVKEGTYYFVITEVDKDNILLGKYKITVVVKDDGKGNLEPKIKGFDNAEINDNAIEFINTYSDTSFNLNIAKTIEGREWDSDDEFTFKITPDDTTKKAIDDGTIVMPTGDVIHKESDGSYTVTLNGKNNPLKTFTQALDKITIKNTGELKVNTKYKFTIEEVTEKLEEMYCREPSIDLFVTITELPSSHTGTSSDNGITATFAHVVDGDITEHTHTGPDVTIPFTNVAAGKLTVAKKVVSNSETDETEFGFTVKFTYADGTTEKDHVINETSDVSKEITLDKSDDGESVWTYTFKLKDGEKVEFSNIPPGTKYEIKETIEKAYQEKYMLLRVCGAATDNGIDLREDGTGESVNGTLNYGSGNSQYRLFVNGLIRELPSAGGGGIDHIIFLGTAFTVSSILLIAMLFYKRRRRI